MTQPASFDYLRARAIRAVNRLSPQAGPIKTVRVHLRSGMMAGLTSDLDGQGFSIGGDMQHDIILLDPELEQSDLRVTSRRSAIGPLVHLNSDQPGITVNGTPIDGPGVWERLPCSVDMNGIVIDLDRPDPGNNVATTGMIYFGMLAIAACALALFPEQIPTHDVTAATEISVPSEPRINDRDLNQMIETAGLAKYLTVQSAPGSTLRVSGRVPKAQMQAWRDLRMAWDTYADAPPLVSRVTQMKGLNALPPIAAVRLGDEPYILLASGQNVVPGDTLTDGWTVTEIRPSSFLLTRNGENIDIAF